MTPGEAPCGLVEDGLLAVENDTIVYTGARASWPERVRDWSGVDLRNP